MSILKKAIKSLFITSEYLGRKGELTASLRLGWVDFFGYEGKILRNIYVPKGNGETSEIDLLYITRKGLFVIESKNYSGYIFGNEQYKNWTSTLYAGKTWLNQNKVEKHHFYNPIWQNNSHIRNLRKYLGQDIPMFSVIAFSDHCELKDITVTSPGVVVCTQDCLASKIRKIWRISPDALDDTQIEELYEALSDLTHQSDDIKKKHIDDINHHLNDTEQCPWCDGTLVLRTAKSGKYAGQQFYGCSNYPRCKYIKNL